MRSQRSVILLSAMLSRATKTRWSLWIALLLITGLVAVAANSVTRSPIHAGPQGTLTVQKVIDDGKAGADNGIFDLYVHGFLQANNVTDTDNAAGVIDGTTPLVSVIPGVISFHELAEATTSLTSYTITVLCTGAAASPSNVSTGGFTIAVANGENVVCTITNQRTGPTLTVRKVIDNGTPTVADSGRFNLLIAGIVRTSNILDTTNLLGVIDGTTAAVAVTAGTVSFQETTTPNTSLASYTISVTCTGALAGQPTLIGVGSWTISIGANENVVCTITNIRNTGTLTVQKVIDDGQPGADAGVVDLYIGGILYVNNVVDTDNAAGVVDGTTTAVAVTTAGTVAFHEIANAGTNLSSYVISVACSGTTALPTNTSTGAWTIAVTTVQNVICTITNTRNSGTLTVQKVIDDGQPGADAGVVDLYIAGSLYQDNVIDTDNAAGLVDGTTTAIAITPAATVTFHELANTGTDLNAYDISVICTGTINTPDNTGLGAWTIAVGPGENVVCTISNNLMIGTLTVEKIFDNGGPGQDGGTVDLFIADNREASDVTDDEEHSLNIDGTTGPVFVGSGNTAFREEGGDGTNLDLYGISIDCTGAASDPVESDLGSWEINIGSGEDVVCTITNARNVFPIAAGGGFYTWTLCDGHASDFFLNTTIVWLWVPNSSVAPFGSWVPFIPEIWLIQPGSITDFALTGDGSQLFWLVSPSDQELIVCPPPF